MRIPLTVFLTFAASMTTAEADPRFGNIGRKPLTREQMALKTGGSRETEAAVGSALRWLARNQKPDGSWPSPEQDLDLGVTALSVLAFLGAGYTHLSKDELVEPGGRTFSFGEAVKKGLQYLVARQEADGCIGVRGPKYMYRHAIATQALTEAYGRTGHLVLKEPAQKAVDFLVSAQNPRQGWRYAARCGDNDTSVTAWALLALKSAELSELPFPKSVLEDALLWIASVTDVGGGHGVGYTAKGTGKVFVPGKNESFDPHPTMTAMGVLGRILIRKNKRDQALDGVLCLISDPPEWKENRIDAYYWLFGSFALFQYDGPAGPLWKKWNEPMKNALVPNQEKDGSWNPDQDRWGCVGGRAFVTAMNAMTLGVYYRWPNVFVGASYQK